MKADPRTEAEVMHVLSRIVETASSRDVDGAMALFADDPNVFLLGTGVDEARTGHAAIREQIERDLTQSDALSWTLSPQNISAAGSVAWTSGDVVVRVGMGGQTLDIPHRLTTVLERRGAKWLIQQMHLSFANGAQVVGQSYPTNLEAVADAVGRERVDLQARVAPDGTVTLLFTDIEGSTQMAEHLGDLRWLALPRQTWKDYEPIARDVFEISHELASLWEPGWQDLKVRSLYDGEIAQPGEPVMHIEGDYASFAHLETLYLGALAEGTRVATNTREVPGL